MISESIEKIERYFKNLRKHKNRSNYIGVVFYGNDQINVHRYEPSQYNGLKRSQWKDSGTTLLGFKIWIPKN